MIDLLGRKPGPPSATDKAAFASLNEEYQPDLWNTKQFAVILKRPFFLQFFTCFLGGIALLSLIVVACSSDPKQLSINAIGYFLGLWGVRQALSVDAPKTATLIDYAVLILYGLLAVAVLFRLLWGFTGSIRGESQRRGTEGTR